MQVFEIRGGFGFDALIPAERPQPEPGPHQALVKLHAASLNYRDLMVVKGQYNPKMPLPRIPLSDGAGEVVAVGSAVKRVKAGDRVAAAFMQTWHDGDLSDAKMRSDLGGSLDGLLAEYAVLHEEGLVHVPAHLSFAEAATLPCAAVTAWHALMSPPLQPGQSVLVLGTGGVSMFALQFAKLAGARVIATSSSDEKLAHARKLGASDGINYKATPDWDKRVRELTGGVGVDHVIEVGGAGTLPQSMKAVRTGGRISLIGVLAGAGGQVNPLPALMRNLQIQGIFVGSRAMFEAMNRAIDLHQLRPVIDREFPFAEAREALKYLESGAHFGKVVIRFG